MKKEDLDHLKEIMKEFNEASEKKDIDKVIEKDVEFHDVIYQATNNEKLIQIINNLREQIHRYRVAYLKSFADYKFIGEEHKQIIRAIENKDQNLAEQIANEHIKNQEKTVINYIKQGSKN